MLTRLDYNKSCGELSINTLVDDLVKQCEFANEGDLTRADSLLTAQAHGRATLEALVAIKNPQQVNNGVPTDASRAGKSKHQPNTVLGHQ